MDALDSPDIVARLDADFGSSAGRARARLAAMKPACGDAPVSARVYRCAIHLAAGSTDRLDSAIELAQTDVRDLIWRAEYDSEDLRRRIWDFSRPFHAARIS